MSTLDFPNPTPAQRETISALLQRFSGQFMHPEICSGPYAEIESPIGESRWVPSDCFAPGMSEDGETVTLTQWGILIRLSAPGYMDCTEWEPCSSWPEVISRLTQWCEEMEFDNADN